MPILSVGLHPFKWNLEHEAGESLFSPFNPMDSDPRGDPSYVFHPMNAYSDGDIVTCDVCEYAEAPLFPHVDGTPPDPEKSSAYLKRWTFDLGKNSDDYTVDQLDISITRLARCPNTTWGRSSPHRNRFLLRRPPIHLKARDIWLQMSTMRKSTRVI